MLPTTCWGEPETTIDLKLYPFPIFSEWYDLDSEKNLRVETKW